MQSLITDGKQQTPQTRTTTPSLETEPLIEGDSVKGAAPVAELDEETTKRKPLIFDSEPSQRMVVVRRRRKRRSRKTDKTERWLSRIRVVLLVVIGCAVVAKLFGYRYLAGMTQQLREALHPVKQQITGHTPDFAMIVLILIAVGLVYTMPGVQSRVNRALGWGSSSKRGSSTTR